MTHFVRVLAGHAEESHWKKEELDVKCGREGEDTRGTQVMA